jgi:DNA-binding MarR family transcriptional regulator
MGPLGKKEKEMMDYIEEVIHRFVVTEHHPGLDICRKAEMTMIDILGKRGPMIMTELSDAAQLCVSTATGLIDGLVSKSLVKRSRSEEDRRIVQVELTEEGQKIYECAMDARLRMVRGMLGALDRNEQEIFVTLFKKIVGGNGTENQRSTIKGSKVATVLNFGL